MLKPLIVTSLTEVPFLSKPEFLLAVHVEADRLSLLESRLFAVPEPSADCRCRATVVSWRPSAVELSVADRCEVWQERSGAWSRGTLVLMHPGIKPKRDSLPKHTYSVPMCVPTLASSRVEFSQQDRLSGRVRDEY